MTTKDAATETARSAAPASARHATLRYTSLRVTIFLACFLLCWLLALAHIIPVAGASGAILLVLIAAFLSAPISYVALNKQRNAMSEQITTSVQRVKERRESRPGKPTMAQRIAAQNAAEDEIDEANRAAG